MLRSDGVSDRPDGMLVKARGRGWDN